MCSKYLMCKCKMLAESLVVPIEPETCFEASSGVAISFVTCTRKDCPSGFSEPCRQVVANVQRFPARAAHLSYSIS